MRMLGLEGGEDIKQCANEDVEHRRLVDIGRCASEDARPRRGMDCKIPHRLERGMKHSL